MILLPVLIPLAAAALMVALGRSPRPHRWVGRVASLLHLAASSFLFAEVWNKGPQALAVGGWKAPVGIVFVADTLACLMLLAASVLGAIGIWAAGKSVERPIQKLYFHPVLMTLMAGVSGSFLTGDIFNLYVWFEVMLMSSFVLMAMGKDKKQTPAALRYMALNLIGSILFLSGCGLIYGLTGTLNMAHLGLRLDQAPPQLTSAVSLLFLFAFLIKAAAFPLFGWLPSSYPAASPAVAAVMAGLLTKVGVYALYRVFSVVFSLQGGFSGPLLLAISAVTMIVGVIGAYGQGEYRRVLTFHIISQIGYMLAGLAIGGPAAIAGGLFMVLHNMAAKTGLFYLAASSEEAHGTPELKEMGGMRQARPAEAMLFLACGLGLAGAPPLSGFFAKLSLLQGAALKGRWEMVAIMLAVGVVTLMSMIKIWSEAYAKPLPEGSRLEGGPKAKWILPAAILAAVVVFLGIGAGPVQEVLMRAGTELSDPELYRRLVLGDSPP